MKNHRIIQVRYLGATNTKGSRVVLTEDRHGKKEKVTLSFDYESDSIVKQAEKYLISKGINIVGFGTFNGNEYIFSDSWAYDKGYINLSGNIE